jgi:antitoxin (DNA-binding transcriptional repressor) of toxin-antitoxin stability system
MDTVGTGEAKMRRLTCLLDRLAAGEQITVTRHGTPTARGRSFQPRCRRDGEIAIQGA